MQVDRLYQEDAFFERIDFAAKVISSGAHTTRNFDTCFEMFDGGSVSAALVRRAKANPASKLAQNLYRYIVKEASEKAYEETKHLSRAGLAQHAAEKRECGKKVFEAFMEKHREEQSEGRG